MPDSKNQSSAAQADLYRKNRELLLHARASGDKKAELVLSLIAVSDEAMKMREAVERVFSIYDDGLEELAGKAEQFFPIDLAVKIEALQELFSGLSENVEHTLSESTSVVVKLRDHVVPRR